MSKAVNTIARGIEAGALKAGASQYLEALEAAKRELKWGQVLLIVTIDFDPDYSEDSILLFDFGEVYGIERMDITKTSGRQDVKEAYFGEGIDYLGEDGRVLFGSKNMEFLNVLELPKNLKTISANAFAGANSATKDLHLPEGLREIGASAFEKWGAANWYGENIPAIYIPDTVETIGANAFKDVPHIYYNGPATWPEGNDRWGAMKMN